MFHGSIVALVTPMQPDGVIDIESLRNLIEWHIGQGTDAIGVLGTTGEAPTVDYVERKIVIQQAVEQAKGRAPIIAGTGTYATQSTIQLTREAMEAGADACLLITPYCNKPTQEGLYQHFKAVATAVPIPQILYNVPSRTACDLKPSTIAHLASCSNIVGVKEATGDVARVQEILALTAGHSLDLYSGDDETCLDFILAGGRGVISITSNVAPRLMHNLCKTALAGAAAEAREIDRKLAKLHKQMCVETNPIPVKWALQQMGLIPAGIRLPLTSLSESCHASVREAMMDAGMMRPIKMILLTVLSFMLAACAMMTPKKDSQSVALSKTAPEQVTEDSQDDTLTKKPEAAPNIVDTQSAEIAASMGKQATEPLSATVNNPPVAVAPIVAPSHPSGAELVNVKGQQGLSLSLPYQQVWAQAKKALPQAGYPIMEQDNTSGTYYILDKAGTGGVIKRDTPIYQLHIQKNGDKTIITLNNAQNQPAAANVSDRILGALKNKLAL